MNRLKLSCFADFLKGFLKPSENPLKEGTVNSMAEKAQVFG
jgi:hypothetical protein